MPNVTYRTSIAVFALTALLGGCAPQEGFSGWSPSSSDEQYKVTTSSDRPGGRLPSMVVTNDPPPEIIYRRGSRDTVLADSGAMASPLPSFSAQRVETLVTRKVSDLARDLAQLQNETQGYQDRLRSLQSKNDAIASEYYALVATINTELQSGTTPGNPMLTERWNASEDKLNALAQSTGYLNELATDLSGEASRAAYLQESVQATYGLSGAVEEDHRKLQSIEDAANQNIVAINRLLTSVNDEIKRRDAYLRSERLNMQTLSLSISNGEMYGQSLTNSLFRKAAADGADVYSTTTPASHTPTGKRPLVVIRFDRPNVNYEQPVYGAISQALQKYPAAKFELVAVSPSEGNPAELALATTEARKNGEGVLRSMTQMGLPLERITLSAANSPDVRNSEVRIFIR